jgi:hypothetical protein
MKNGVHLVRLLAKFGATQSGDGRLNAFFMRGSTVGSSAAEI